MNGLLNQHVQAIKQVVTRMRSNMLSSFIICMVVGIALCLPSLFYISIDHLSKLTSHIQNETEISLFLKLDVSAKKITEINTLLAKNASIKQFRLVSKEEAWNKLKVSSEASNDSSNAIHQLTKNPLPDAFFIHAKSTNPVALETLKNTLQAIPDVEQVLLNTEWAKRLSALLNLGEKIVIFISLLLAITLLVVIGNTVRMQILTQKDEIEVSNLMGATSSFIRMPFLYAGMLYGLFGGLLAVLMVAGIVQLFNYAVAPISSLYHSDFSLTLSNHHLFFAMIGAAIFIGWLGSHLAVSRSLASIVLGQNVR